jgi:hypothetical protein
MDRQLLLQHSCLKEPHLPVAPCCRQVCSRVPLANNTKAVAVAGRVIADGNGDVANSTIKPTLGNCIPGVAAALVAGTAIASLTLSIPICFKVDNTIAQGIDWSLCTWQPPGKGPVTSEG